MGGPWSEENDLLIIIIVLRKFIAQILEEHNSPAGGHFDIHKTFESTMAILLGDM